MRNNFGTEIKDQLFAFPSLDQLKIATESDLRNLGFGYRASFIVDSVKTIESNGGEKWLREMRGKDLEIVRKNLM